VGWGPAFPPFPQGRENRLWKAQMLCEERVPSPMNRGAATTLSCTGSVFRPFWPARKLNRFSWLEPVRGVAAIPEEYFLRCRKVRDFWPGEFLRLDDRTSERHCLWDGAGDCNGDGCAERINKKTVVPVVHKGKVEMWMKWLRKRGLRMCPVFHNVAVQFRTFG
jgi:hypothetical protein